MAHEIDMTNDRANMAWTGEVPWHGLGQSIDAAADLDTWIEQAGFGWDIRSAPVQFSVAGSEELGLVPRRNVLYRSDTGTPLSVVSDNYRVTQPREVAEFFRELVEAGGFRMETMGMLDGGRKYWALARVDDDCEVSPGDTVLPYLLLASSADGSMSNCADFTTVRVVCQNTLSYSIGAGGQFAKIRIPHSTTFNAERVKTELGLVGASWSRFKTDADEYRRYTMSKEAAVGFLLGAMYPNVEVEGIDLTVRRKGLEQLLNGYENGPGQDLAGAHDNLWKVLNAITLYTDHNRAARSQDTRLSTAWFGAGAAMKARAVQAAHDLISA